MNGTADETAEQKALFESYKDFSLTLRAWLIAYGVGGPVILLSQEHLWKKLSSDPNANLIGALFLIGVGLQVFFAAFFKWAMWEIWRATSKPELKTRCPYKIANSASEWYWIDLVTDWGAILAFGFATAISARALL